MTEEESSPFPPFEFERQDESDDRLFYRHPRLVVHVDDQAIAAIGELFEEVIPPNSVVLDLLSSWRSHWPRGYPKARMVGLGLNRVEMQENPDLDDYVVHDVNRDPRLPFDDASFDSVVIAVSVQYLIRPIEVFRDVHRVLKPGGSFLVIFSNRMFFHQSGEDMDREQRRGQEADRDLLLPPRKRLRGHQVDGAQPAAGPLRRPDVRGDGPKALGPARLAGLLRRCRSANGDPFDKLKSG